MEKARHGRHSGKESRRKRSTKSKKRKSHEENGTSSPDNDGTVVTGNKPLVEYSDVSSEDLSGPEAGEIQSGEESVFAFSGDEGKEHRQLAMNRNRRYRTLLEEEYYLARGHLMVRSSPRRVHPELLPTHSPTPSIVLPPQRERKTSVSSRSSPSSEVRARRKVNSSPLGDYRHIESPFDDVETERRKRKRKEKKHKRDKKSKKKKKKLKHQSRSTSVDSSDSVPAVASQSQPDQEPLSDWEAPALNPDRRQSIEKIDTSACSPVSNDSHIASPEPEDIIEHSRHRTPPVSPVRLLKDLPPRESPHTPPLLPSRSYGSSHTVIVRERSMSPIVIPHERERSNRPGYVFY